MTKERRLAIEMWEYIRDHLTDIGFSLFDFKEKFCEEHNLDWQNDCWFCQYVRKDYRMLLHSREDINSRKNCCNKCPLSYYLENKHPDNYNVKDDPCGCSFDNKSLFEKAIDGSTGAADFIVEALKGEPIWRNTDVDI